MSDAMEDLYRMCPPGGSATMVEEAQILVDGVARFTDKKFTFDEAEEMIKLCINGIGWPKERDLYEIRVRTVVHAEGPWRIIKE